MFHPQCALLIFSSFHYILAIFTGNLFVDMFFYLGEAAGSLSLAAKRVRVRHVIRGDTRGPGQVGPHLRTVPSLHMYRRNRRGTVM
jgi:hypothetical protein